jgi:phospholipid/cholesterol/gamma-HCH transport system ATP-binding protein
MGVLVKLIYDLNHSLGLTSVVVSHDVRETAAIADYVYLVSEGRVVGQGTPAQIERSASPWVRQFMHGEADGPVPFHFPAPDYARDLLGGAGGRRGPEAVAGLN